MRVEAEDAIAGIAIFTTNPKITRRSLAEAYAPLAMMAADATSARIGATVDRSRRAAVQDHTV